LSAVGGAALTARRIFFSTKCAARWHYSIVGQSPWDERKQVEIRTFRASDRTALLELFGRVGEGSPSASLWGHEASEAAVYLTPYIDLEPDSLFVADDGDHLVGYLAGCVDSARFPGEEDRMAHAIKTYRLFTRRTPMAFFARATVDVAWAKLRGQPTAGDFEDPRWPAHLHINVAPEARGTGVADELMSRWLGRLREHGSPGCHLQTLLENNRAVRFFERMGFSRHGPTPLVPGVRYAGHRLHQQTMVQPLVAVERA
jgi:ribosomal protein S18 acetylase RimI-like enzyme